MSRNDLTRSFTEGLSGGNIVSVTQTATAGNVAHVANNVMGKDFVHLWAQNKHTSAVDLSIEVTDSADNVLYTMVVNLGIKNVPTKVLDGFYLANGNKLKAFAGTTAVVALFGHVEKRNNI